MRCSLSNDNDRRNLYSTAWPEDHLPSVIQNRRSQVVDLLLALLHYDIETTFIAHCSELLVMGESESIGHNRLITHINPRLRNEGISIEFGAHVLHHGTSPQLSIKINR